MISKILVEVGYYDYYFDCITDAVAFASMAVEHISENDREVKLTAIYTKAEEISEDGKD